MKVLRLFLLALATFTVAAASSRPVESTHLKMIVGVTDDTAKWMTRDTDCSKVRGAPAG